LTPTSSLLACSLPSRGFFLQRGQEPRECYPFERYADSDPAFKGDPMKTFTAVVEKCQDTGLYVGYVPGFPGAHSQAESLDELNSNLREVVELLLEEGEPSIETQFVGTQLVTLSDWWGGSRS